MEGSSYEGTLGAPLDLLLSSKKKFENLSDEKVEKLHKVSTFTFATWILISNTAFRKLMRTRGVVKPFEMPLFVAAAIVLKSTPIRTMMSRTLRLCMQYLVPHPMVSPYPLRQSLPLRATLVPPLSKLLSKLTPPR